MDEKEKLYKAVQKILNSGSNVEIRKRPDGSMQVLEVKKHNVAL